jgi:hypothetical protein
MADITLGNLIALVFDELATSVEQTADRAELLRLHLSDVDLDIPAHLRLPVASEDSPEPARLMVTLPSTRETPLGGRLGRVHIAIEATRSVPAEDLVPAPSLPTSSAQGSNVFGELSDGASGNEDSRSE